MPQLYSDQMNDTTFRVYIPEYYIPALPNYFKNHRSSGYAVVNGRMVSDEEYYEITGLKVDRDDFIPKPIYMADDLNMCISSCSPAMIIDMDINLVPFKFKDIEDMPRVCEIMRGYDDEMSPYLTRSQDLKRYMDNVRSTRVKLQTAYDEIKRDYAINHGLEQPKDNSLATLLKNLK